VGYFSFAAETLFDLYDSLIGLLPQEIHYVGFKLAEHLLNAASGCTKAT
jgi:hypothetical protein